MTKGEIGIGLGTVIGIPTGHTFTMGQCADGTTGMSNGYLDEIGIWSKALSTNEISDLYNGGAGQTMFNGTGGPLCSTPRHKIIIVSFEAKLEHFQLA